MGIAGDGDGTARTRKAVRTAGDLFGSRRKGRSETTHPRSDARSANQDVRESVKSMRSMRSRLRTAGVAVLVCIAAASLGGYKELAESADVLDRLGALGGGPIPSPSPRQMFVLLVGASGIGMLLCGCVYVGIRSRLRHIGLLLSIPFGWVLALVLIYRFVYGDFIGHVNIPMLYRWLPLVSILVGVITAELLDAGWHSGRKASMESDLES